MLSPNLEHSLQSLAQRIRRLPSAEPRIAVFDFDNTLIAGDIGEAVFGQLLIDGFQLNLTFSDYISRLQTDRAGAYRSAVLAMDGVTDEEILAATLKVMNSSEWALSVEGHRIPIPLPIPHIVSLLARLQQFRFEKYVISASNQLSVREAAHRWYGLKNEFVFGTVTNIHDHTWSRSLKEPVPIGRGKVSKYFDSIGKHAPLVTAGDSELDLPLLELTDPNGLILWAGAEEFLYDSRATILREHPHVALLPTPAVITA